MPACSQPVISQAILNGAVHSSAWHGVYTGQDVLAMCSTCRQWWASGGHLSCVAATKLQHQPVFPVCRDSENSHSLLLCADGSPSQQDPTQDPEPACEQRRDSKQQEGRNLTAVHLWHWQHNSKGNPKGYSEYQLQADSAGSSAYH